MVAALTGQCWQSVEGQSIASSLIQDFTVIERQKHKLHAWDILEKWNIKTRGHEGFYQLIDVQTSIIKLRFVCLNQKSTVAENLKVTIGIVANMGIIENKQFWYVI